MIAAGLGGMLLGVALAALARGRERQHARRRMEHLCAQWLAARRTLGRASLSLVSAMRSLAAEAPDSPWQALRVAEAQRARADWCDALIRLDAAEAEWLAWSASRGDPRLALGEDPVGSGAVRVAIDGDASDVERLVEALREADRQAAQRVVELLAGRGGRLANSWLGRRVSELASVSRRIVTGWAERP
ncbi:MAG: hypothetical protein HY763_10345 [Planctomycetes bacterium]|nr:hypothetical protein [Planctomycetota bacterium]